TQSPTTPTHTLSLHDALPIYEAPDRGHAADARARDRAEELAGGDRSERQRAAHAADHRGDPRHQAPGDPALAHDLAREDEERDRSEEHTSELQSRSDLVCRLL